VLDIGGGTDTAASACKHNGRHSRQSRSGNTACWSPVTHDMKLSSSLQHCNSTESHILQLGVHLVHNDQVPLEVACRLLPSYARSLPAAHNMPATDQSSAVEVSDS
jgi:hypothetical protein